MIAAIYTPEQSIAVQELTEAIDRFLSSLQEEDRDIFVCRYWFLAPTAEISKKFNISLSKVKSSLFRTRKKLKAHLEKEVFI